MQDTPPHLDVLQNIEFIIVSVYREKPDLNDYQVMEALDAIINRYRAEARGHFPKEPSLKGYEMDIFLGLKALCEWRLGRRPVDETAPEPPGGETKLEDLLDCLRKVRKSVDRHNKGGGRQAYLEFVSEYIL